MSHLPACRKQHDRCDCPMLEARECAELDVAAAVAGERERCMAAVHSVFERWARPEYGLLRSDIARALRGGK